MTTKIGKILTALHENQQRNFGKFSKQFQKDLKRDLLKYVRKFGRILVQENNVKFWGTFSEKFENFYEVIIKIIFKDFQKF